MSIDLIGKWVGASGNEYLYHSYALDAVIPPRLGNYIYAKKNFENLWVPLYMGEGDLSLRCTDEEILECVRSRGATHVHLRLNRSEEDRRFELRDLLDRYQNAFRPDGCQRDEDRRVPPKAGRGGAT